MSAGRQREFNKEEALEKAMYVFWKKGYVGASLTDLTKEMGINKPSMYSAFGNKEALFVDAAQMYVNKFAKPHVEFLHQDSVSLKARLTNYLESIVRTQCDLSKPPGCFISMCVTEAAGDSVPELAMQTVKSASQFTENYLTEFLSNEQSEGNLSRALDSRELAIYIMTILHGTAAHARNGKSLNQLNSVIRCALDGIVFT